MYIAFQKRVKNVSKISLPRRSHMKPSQNRKKKLASNNKLKLEMKYNYGKYINLIINRRCEQAKIS